MNKCKTITKRYLQIKLLPLNLLSKQIFHLILLFASNFQWTHFISLRRKLFFNSQRLRCQLNRNSGERLTVYIKMQIRVIGLKSKTSRSQRLQLTESDGTSNPIWKLCPLWPSSPRRVIINWRLGTIPMNNWSTHNHSQHYPLCSKTSK